MSKQFPREAKNWVQDVMHGAGEKEVEEVLTLLSDLLKPSSRRKPGKQPLRCDHATALASVCRAMAERDPTMIQIRRLPLEQRKRILVTLLNAIKLAEPDQIRRRSIGDSEPDITVPGVLIGSCEEVVRIPAHVIGGHGSSLRRAARWFAKEAARITTAYAIKPEMALLYLFLDDAFAPRPSVSWRIEVHPQHPSLTRLHLDLDPNLSTEEVAEAYATARSEAGVGRLRAQRGRTYGLATLCAGLIGIIDWRTLLVIWNGQCWENGFRDWIYCSDGKAPSDDDLYQFTRDAKRAVKSLLER